MGVVEMTSWDPDTLFGNTFPTDGLRMQLRKLNAPHLPHEVYDMERLGDCEPVPKPRRLTPFTHPFNPITRQVAAMEGIVSRDE